MWGVVALHNPKATMSVTTHGGCCAQECHRRGPGRAGACRHLTPPGDLCSGRVCGDRGAPGSGQSGRAGRLERGQRARADRWQRQRYRVAMCCRFTALVGPTWPGPRRAVGKGRKLFLSVSPVCVSRTKNCVVAKNPRFPCAWLARGLKLGVPLPREVRTNDGAFTQPRGSDFKPAHTTAA